MTALLAHLLTDLFTVSHPGRVQFGVHAEAALELAHQHVNLNVARAGDHHLMGFGVVDHTEGGILFVEADEAAAYLFILAAGLRGDGPGVAGLGKLHRSQLHHLLGVAQRLAGLQAVHFSDGADIAAGDLLDLLVLLALDGIQAAKLLCFAGGGIVESHIAGDLAGNREYLPYWSEMVLNTMAAVEPLGSRLTSTAFSPDSSAAFSAGIS